MSYNVIMTENYLQVVPRTAESYIASNGNKISVNSLGFAGMVLVKRQEDLDILKRIGVLNILKDLGYRPVASGESSDEVPATAGAEATGTQATNQVSSQAIE
jgi:ATP adenylyltransferase